MKRRRRGRRIRRKKERKKRSEEADEDIKRRREEENASLKQISGTSFSNDREGGKYLTAHRLLLQLNGACLVNMAAIEAQRCRVGELNL